MWSNNGRHFWSKIGEKWTNFSKKWPKLADFPIEFWWNFGKISVRNLVEICCNLGQILVENWWKFWWKIGENLVETKAASGHWSVGGALRNRSVQESFSTGRTDAPPLLSLAHLHNCLLINNNLLMISTNCSAVPPRIVQKCPKIPKNVSENAQKLLQMPQKCS